MVKKFLISFLFILLFLVNSATSIQATDVTVCTGGCNSGDRCVTDPKWICKPSQADPTKNLWQPASGADVFGKVTAPSPLAGFIARDPTGSFGISQFLSNLVSLFFILAGIVLIFVLIWGAFDWMISEGDKEKLAAARGKIISAIIGIFLFAIAFAAIQLLGNFTGFTFFRGQH